MAELAMGVFAIDLTRARRAKAAGMIVCAVLVLVLVLVVALVSNQPRELWLLLVAVPFLVAAGFWLVADRAAWTAEQRGQNPHLRDDAH